jgi:hypothetical protein
VSSGCVPEELRGDLGRDRVHGEVSDTFPSWGVSEEDCAGSLEVGKQADVLILDAPSHEHLCYHFGVNLVDTVVKNGKVVVEGGQRVR